MTAAAERLSELLRITPAQLAGISEESASKSVAPGRWSKKQILGHLIDSASNNHQRFVRAQAAPSLEFPSYEQEVWVNVQSYGTASWDDLTHLWAALNRHLLHIIQNVPADCLSRPVSIGGKPATPLSAVIEDYLGHLQHHLAQIFDRA
ncbi:MAG TPA: DinB family protein [Bryobacteraceae bacterium]|nr:DinB family protein [Bryobacteraceae bacterium]